ncbi:hypothetical protein Tco_1036983, partial [Tanacetum coccineum]
MCIYLKNMARFTHSKLKKKSFDEVQKAFDKTMGWIDSFVSMDFEVVKGGKEKDEGSVTRAEESSSKRAGTELEQERVKKQKIDDDQEEAEIKKHMEIVFDEEEIVIDAIPLATKPLIIVDWKIPQEIGINTNIAEWDNVQAMIDADYKLAARLQVEEQGELTIEEKSRLFVELMKKRKKHFARLREEEVEMKKHMVIVPNDELAIDAIPLATKPLIIVEWKIIKEGKMGY